jgi:hypothetical protein
MVIFMPQEGFAALIIPLCDYVVSKITTQSDLFLIYSLGEKEPVHYMHYFL